MWEFIIGDVHGGIDAFFLGENGVEELVGVNLVLPMALWHAGEIRDGATVEFDALFHQFPPMPAVPRRECWRKFLRLLFELWFIMRWGVQIVS